MGSLIAFIVLFIFAIAIVSVIKGNGSNQKIRNGGIGGTRHSGSTTNNDMMMHNAMLFNAHINDPVHYDENGQCGDDNDCNCDCDSGSDCYSDSGSDCGCDCGGDSGGSCGTD